MTDYFEYVSKKLAPKPSYERPIPKFERETKEEPIHVEESILDTIRMKALNFVRR